MLNVITRGVNKMSKCMMCKQIKKITLVRVDRGDYIVFLDLCKECAEKPQD